MLLRTVEGMRGSGARVFTVDIGFGRTWRLPNLYFLADLLERRTDVQRLIFVAGAPRADRSASPLFIGMSSPAEFRGALEAHHKQFQEAATEEARAAGRSLTDQFESIKRHLAGQSELHDWVTESTVERHLGRRRLEADVLDRPESLTEVNYRRVINGDTTFVAVTAGKRLRTVIDRDRLALKVARSAAKN